MRVAVLPGYHTFHKTISHQRVTRPPIARWVHPVSLGNAPTWPQCVSLCWWGIWLAPCNNRWRYQSARQIKGSRMQGSRGNILNRASTEREISQVRMERRGCLPLSGGCRALWENGHANEGQIRREQLHCKWADFEHVWAGMNLRSVVC